MLPPVPAEMKLGRAAFGRAAPVVMVMPCIAATSLASDRRGVRLQARLRGPRQHTPRRASLRVEAVNDSISAPAGPFTARDGKTCSPVSAALCSPATRVPSSRGPIAPGGAVLMTWQGGTVPPESGRPSRNRYERSRQVPWLVRRMCIMSNTAGRVAEESGSRTHQGPPAAPTGFEARPPHRGRSLPSMQDCVILHRDHRRARTAPGGAGHRCAG